MACLQSFSGVSACSTYTHDVRFTPESGHVQCTSPCPLWAKSRHVQCSNAWPLYTRKQTCAAQLEMSALGQKRTHAPQQTASLFDHLVGTTLHRLRHGEAERLGGLEVDDHFELAEDLSYRAAYAAFSKPSACIASLTFGRAPTRSA